MTSFIFRIFLTAVYAFIGLKLAFPLSYFFQDSLYSEMSFSEYVSGGNTSIIIGSQFGAYDTYRMTLYSSVIIAVIVGKLVEHFVRKKIESQTHN